MSFPCAPSQHKKKAISNNIPLPSSYVSRTESEVQLAMDVAAAERRDERMFHRLINGIQDRHRQMKKTAGASTQSRSTPISGDTDHKCANDVDIHECSHPFTAIANIVGTHHSEIGDTTDAVLDTQRHQEDDRNDEQPPSMHPTILKNCTCKNLSDSTLSDNDWSITGYEFSTADNVDHKGIIQEGEDEDIFILDL
jgi:hypothetical protein